MKAKNRIKIVKRAEREDESKVEKSRAPQQGQSAQNPTQKMARQVASWVKEFELRRRATSARNFASLFMEPDLKSVS